MDLNENHYINNINNMSKQLLMEKENLEKLSKSQLIEFLLKQDKKNFKI